MIHLLSGAFHGCPGLDVGTDIPHAARPGWRTADCNGARGPNAAGVGGRGSLEPLPFRAKAWTSWRWRLVARHREQIALGGALVFSD